jgi:phosphoserine aminotransferase
MVMGGIIRGEEATMARVYNFSAGPAVLPEPVLHKAAAEMLEYRDSGMSVMEMSHRGGHFEKILNDTEALLRTIMNIPSGYRVLFLQGGASSQFAMVPLNLFSGSKKCEIIHTGEWTRRAIAEARKFGAVTVLASSEDRAFSYIPEVPMSAFSPDADYVHICTNNTIEGTRFPALPDTGSVPLVADMSSNILSEVMDISRFALIFAGAQKNIGPAGLTIVIIRDDLVGRAMDITPTMLNFKTHADNGSMYNTPPTYCIYIAGLVFEWIRDRGGLSAMEELNRIKAAMLYDYLDASKLFRATVAAPFRSLMNIPFVTGEPEIHAAFIGPAAAAGLTALRGHRSAGGMRASLYNAMPLEGVRELVRFMETFEKKRLKAPARG